VTLGAALSETLATFAAYGEETLACCDEKVRSCSDDTVAKCRGAMC
jgi:hypothetical protein